MWLLALLVAVFAVRYFLPRPPLLLRAQVLALSRHPVWLLLHIAAGIVAITLGLFQFVGSLRVSHPALHRVMGRLYVTAVVVGGCAGLRLSPDTRVFVADGLNDGRLFDLVTLRSASFGYSPPYHPSQFSLVMSGFITLALAWICTSLAAFLLARQRKFDKHRAWMIRSYSLTFAAATVRLVSLPLLFVTRDPVIAITLTFWSWLGNLVVAEWLIRGQGKAALRKAAAVAS